MIGQFRTTRERSCGAPSLVEHTTLMGRARDDDGRERDGGDAVEIADKTRAYSRKNRVHAMRRFVLDTYFGGDGGDVGDGAVLDVAGGKGDLSWTLTNVDDVESVVVDPRRTNHESIERSARYLRDRPDEARFRAVPGRASHQPLARCVVERWGTDTDEENDKFRRPRSLRLHVDAALVETVRERRRRRPSSSGSRDLDANEDADDDDDEEETSSSSWADYFRRASRRAETTCPIYGGRQNERTEPSSVRRREDAAASRVTDPEDAWSVVNDCALVVGFHPDQATEACVDLAIALDVPYAVCPCCVFPSEFPDRGLFLPGADQKQRVRTYDELLVYLRRKDPRARTATLDFSSSTARNVVLYTLPEDCRAPRRVGRFGSTRR